MLNRQTDTVSQGISISKSKWVGKDPLINSKLSIDYAEIYLEKQQQQRSKNKYILQEAFHNSCKGQ